MKITSIDTDSNAKYCVSIVHNDKHSNRLILFFGSMRYFFTILDMMCLKDACAF